MKKVLTLIMVLTGLVAGAQAAKVPNITTSGTITLPMVFEAPEIQDLTTSNIVLHKTVFDDFQPVFTTLTLTLHQNYKAKLVGVAHFGTVLYDAGATVTENLVITSLTGKLKNGKIKKGVEYGPTFSINASTSISTILYKIKVTGTMNKPAFEPSADLDDPAELATAYYNIEVKVTGLARPYHYTLSDVPVKGNFHFRYGYPTPAEMPPKEKPEKYEYFKVTTPWGEDVLQGTFSNTAGLARFNLKGPKFSFDATEDNFNGVDFQPDFYTLKTGMGKSSGVHP